MFAPTASCITGINAQCAGGPILSQSTHLQAALAVWAAAFEHLSDGIVICDSSDNLLLINRALRELIGSNADTPLPQHFSDLPLESYDDPYGLPRNHNDVQHYTIGRRILRCTRSPATGNDGRTVGSVLVLRDVTAEVADRRAVIDFTSTMSSELRTPLTQIFGNTDVLLRGFVGSINNEQKELLQLIRRRAEDLNEFVKDIVIVASITADTFVCNPEPLSLQTVFQEILPSRNARFIDKDIDLQIDISSHLPQLFADYILLRLVLEHLLDNAYRSTRQGSVILRAQIDGGMIRIDVMDTGTDIPPESQIELFKSFFYVPHSGSERGSGLELFIIRELVELQGGRVWAESTPGQGSTFSFTVPQAVPLKQSEI